MQLNYHIMNNEQSLALAKGTRIHAQGAWAHTAHVSFYVSYLLLAGGALPGPLPGVGMHTTAGRIFEAPSIMRTWLVGIDPHALQQEGGGG